MAEAAFIRNFKRS